MQLCKAFSLIRNSVTVSVVCDIFGGLNVDSLLVLTISNLLSATRLNLG